MYVHSCLNKATIVQFMITVIIGYWKNLVLLIPLRSKRAMNETSSSVKHESTP